MTLQKFTNLYMYISIYISYQSNFWGGSAKILGITFFYTNAYYKCKYMFFLFLVKYTITSCIYIYPLSIIIISISYCNS